MNQANQHGFKEHRRFQQANTEPKNQFRLSQFPSASDNISVTQIEQVTRIAHLQAESKMTAIFDILELKVLNRYDFAFSQLKTAQDPFLTIYAHNKTANHLTHALFSKLVHFVYGRTLHQMGFFMTNLRQMTTRTRNENSKREMIRANSRVDRDYDDFEVLQRNNSHEGNGEKAHKMLVKKKEKNEKEMALFKLQMEQLLSQHQAALKKKN